MDSTSEAYLYNDTTESLDGGPTFERVGMPTILMTVCFVGIIGNASVIYVVCRNRHMNPLFMNLAVADFLFNVFCIPIRVAMYATSHLIRIGDFLCKTLNYATYVSMGVSIYSLVAICVLRYAGIKYPLHLRQMLGRTTAYKASIAAWLVMLVLNIPLLVLFDESNGRSCSIKRVTGSNNIDNDSYNSNIGKLNNNSNVTETSSTSDAYWVYYIYVGVTSGIDFALPAVIVAVLSTLIVIQVWAIRDEGKDLGVTSVTSDGYYRVSNRASRRLMVLVMLVFMLFIICWGPLHALFLWKVLSGTNPGPATQLITTIAIILSFANASVNPILYNFVSKEFRSAFARALLPCRKRRSDVSNSSTKLSNISMRSKRRLSDGSEYNPLSSKQLQGNNCFIDLETF